MFVLWAGNMRGPRIQTTVSKLVLLLLLLLSGLTRTALCQDEDTEAAGEITEEEPQDPEVDVADPAAEDTAVEDPAVEDAAVEDTDAVPPEEATEPSEDELVTTPLPLVTDVTDYGSNGEELGSGVPSDLGDEPGSATEGIFGTGSTASPDEGLDLLLIAVPVAVVALLVAIVCGILIYRRSASKNRPSAVRKEDPYLDESTEKVPMPMFEEDVPSVLELEMDELDDWMKKDDLNQQA